MSTIDHSTRPDVTPEMIEAAIRKGRHERSVAFHALLRSIFGRRPAQTAVGTTEPAGACLAGAAGHH